MITSRLRAPNGYTLIELLVLLSIVLTLLGLSVPRAISTIGAIEFRRGVITTLNFLRQSHLDSVVKGNTLSLKLEDDGLTRSDGKKFSLPAGLKLSPSPEGKGPILVVFYPSGRNSSQRFFINDTHDRRALISIDPLSGIPECKYY